MGVGLVAVGAAIAAVVAIAIGGGGESPAAAPHPPAAMPPASPLATTSPPVAPARAATAPGPAAHDDSQPVAGAAAPPAEEPSRPPTITLRFAIEPAGAAITLDGRRASGPEIVMPRDDKAHHRTITAAGYLAHEETIAFDANQRVTVQLKRPAARDKRPRDPDGIASQSPYH